MRRIQIPRSLESAEFESPDPLWIPWVRRVRIIWITWIACVTLSPMRPEPLGSESPESSESTLVSQNSLDMNPLHLTEYPWTTWVPWIGISNMNSIHMNSNKSSESFVSQSPESRESCGWVIVSKVPVVMWAITIFWMARPVNHLSLDPPNHLA